MDLPSAADFAIEYDRRVRPKRLPPQIVGSKGAVLEPTPEFKSTRSFLELKTFADLPADGLGRFVLLSLMMDIKSAAAENDADKLMKLTADIEKALRNVPCAIDEATQSMFFDETIRVSGKFEVRTSPTTCIPISAITTRQPIYCPVHEPGGGHNPSAYVAIGKDGRRMIFCYVCCAAGTRGRPVCEEVHYDSMDLSILAPDNVTTISKSYLEWEDLLPSPNTNIFSSHVVIVRSSMGSGKTTSVQKLITNGHGARGDGAGLRRLKAIACTSQVCPAASLGCSKGLSVWGEQQPWDAMTLTHDDI